MNIFIQIFRQISDIVKRMSVVQRTNFILLLIVIVSFTVFLSIWAGRTDFALLYSNLNQTDAAAIKGKLDEMKIENRIDGTSVYVPSKRVHETRLLLASEGLPQGSSSVGYELFGSPGLGMTDYMQKLNYKRALEGELSRTINSLNGIKQSRVHLAIPKQSLFKSDNVKPTASVVLDLIQSYPLAKDQIGGIIYLVASSVEQLSPQDVTVIDSRGNLLSRMGQESSAAGLSASQLEARKSVESYLKEKAESMLTAILGPGKALVRVNVAMNFDKKEKTAETFDPEGAVPRSEATTVESSSETNGSAAEGANNAGQAGKTKSQEKATTDYEISRTVEKIVSSVGVIRKLSVAVVVDGVYKEVEGEDGETAKEYVPRTTEEKNMYKRLVKNAVGFDDERGDVIEVSDAAFDTSYFDESSKEMAAFQQKEFIINLVKQGGIIVVFLFALFLLFSMLKKVAVSAPAPRARSAGVGGAVNRMAGAEMPGGYGGAQPGLERKVKDTVNKNPDMAADLVNDWLSEE